MNLQNICKNLIYNGSRQRLPENLARFRIICPEYSANDAERKPWPVSEGEPLFALLWDLRGTHSLSATIMPSIPSFTYSTVYTPPMRTQTHSHEYLELFYIIRGEYRQKILGSEFTFSKGELCLIDCGCVHQEILDGSSATVLFLGIIPEALASAAEHLEGSRISSFLSMMLSGQKNIQQYLHFRPRTDTARDIEFTLGSLLMELTRNDKATPIISQGLLLRIFQVLNSQYSFYLSKMPKKETNWVLFEQISAFIKEHLNDISIRMLAEEFHFQDDYFNRMLKSRTGMTYTEYLQSLRIKKAEELLRETDMQIDDIVRKVGYHNKGYFYKIFTEQHRITPAQFRKKLKK